MRSAHSKSGGRCGGGRALLARLVVHPGSSQEWLICGGLGVSVAEQAEGGDAGGHAGGQLDPEAARGCRPGGQQTHERHHHVQQVGHHEKDVAHHLVGQAARRQHVFDELVSGRQQGVHQADGHDRQDAAAGDANLSVCQSKNRKTRAHLIKSELQKLNVCDKI